MTETSTMRRLHPVTASPAIIEVPEEPVFGLSSLRDVAPPPALVARVMTRVSDEQPTLAQWLTRPIRIVLRISPLGIIAISALLALGLALFVAR
jgi:hypothetical protein